MPMSSMTATNLMYSGAVINNGARASSFPSQVDMTCQAINSTHYICKVVEKQVVQNDAGMVVLAIACGFVLFIVAVIVFTHKGWI